MTAQDYIHFLNLQPHPEGGHFAETYRSAELIPHKALPVRFTGTRSFGTAIYFLLESRHISALHRIQGDEIWHFYAGKPLEVFVINPDSTLTVIRLGNDVTKGEVFQAVVPAGCWFGSKPAVVMARTGGPAVDSDRKSADFSLVGCTVAPGFDFADFEMADRATLLAEFPQHRTVIELLTT